MAGRLSLDPQPVTATAAALSLFDDHARGALGHLGRYSRPINRRIWNRMGLSIAAGILLSVTSEVRADPCVARLPDRAGQSFSGQVRYVVDGDGLCVGCASDPATWIEVRLADFDAPELNAIGGQRAKALLKRVTSGRSVVCKAVRGRSGRVVVYDRVIAVCTRDGCRLGDLLREVGGVRGGN